MRLQPEPPLPGHRLEILHEEQDIRQRIAELSKEIREQLGDKDPIVVCVLKGAFVFVADLVRQLDFPFTVDFLRASSYGDSVVTSGEVKLDLDLQQSISNRHVLLVEDIVDTGLTLKYLQSNLESRNPASIKICTLLHKPLNNVKLTHIDFCGFEIPNDFVVGYGLDWQGYYRNLPYIAQVHQVSK
ncbi:MAG: hypoxanthine phosphoribosyltransferase [Planctomycetia bacterium TMED53]|nr:MAG: hypoxanthine phosphoribosyltransferase [Planctomycetia bacterium TMED53]